MEKRFNFVFITTNLINGKQYIGDHSTDNLNSSISKRYLGSGHPYFKNALNEYGRNNFKREILEFFSTKQEAFNAQEKYIQQYNTLSPNGYNLSPKGGTQCNGGMTEAGKRNISKAQRGKIGPNLNKKFSKEHKDKIGKSNKISQLGKHQSYETKLKKSNSMKLWHKNIGFSKDSKEKMRKQHSKRLINITK